ncbi:Nitrile hydratase, alpha chain [Ruegeria intermedia]|uniref:Nitrile hydratase, alpha chain n=1 Tax=Ruegeria intermedia TaxID=996115 RepID=A0A1M4XZ41_9RHOB|nr:Nitrile hydratase, alpha chain [Ruegeria intermedia]
MQLLPVAAAGHPALLYKSDAYRARAVREPRKVLAEFGVRLPPETAVRVWDSTAEVRYLVLPMRPPGTEGMSQDELAALVTRDSMIGTGLPKVPA